ncbi:hypothetical protein ASF58_22755 [Methylobacterium sp. Leaf125]|uniref:hypothetical protein n=1 Tax=Methylobacterium sp. Leaf125 TaxID=1736265 RepID=UPI0006F28589|nr:hypothetical protein [Methylobacterium sp. Leaf125]KQQ39116.1 hypothetical protein ASF58_22755 [Methylobacterium sp. Leaf125]
MNARSLIPSRVRLLVPVLGSDTDGEALGACRAIGRTLAGAGLDFHALADAISTPASPLANLSPYRAGQPPAYRPQRRHAWVFTEKQTADHRQMARYCRDNDRGRLSRRERNFIWTIATHGRELTVPQADWLADITDRLEKEDGRTCA